MTVITTFNIENHPFMISDLLISVNVNHRNRMFRKLPRPIQKFNVALPKDAKYTITNVLQKTVRICERFIMSYSGSVAEAKHVIRHFRTIYQTTEPTGMWFENEINRLISERKINNLSLIVLIEERGRIYSGGFNFKRFRSKKFLHMKAAGSGARDMIEVFGGYRGKAANRTLNPHEEGLSLSLALSSTLLGKELVTGESLKLAYGGFYEISYWGNGDFQKLSDVLHVHWVFEYEPSRGLNFGPPVKIQKMEYHNSVLYLRDIELSDSSKTNDTVYIVKEPEINKVKGKPREIRPELSYSWIVDHLYILLPNGKVRYKNRVQYIQSNKYGLLLAEKNSALELMFKDDYFDFMKEIITELESSDA